MKLKRKAILLPAVLLSIYYGISFPFFIDEGGISGIEELYYFPYTIAIILRIILELILDILGFILFRISSSTLTYIMLIPSTASIWYLSYQIFKSLLQKKSNKHE
jgi:hypothetical protein